MSDQGSLFDPDDGDTARDKAIQRAEEHADDQWKTAALEVVRLCADSLPEFTADDVLNFMATWCPDITTHEPRALGAVFRRAAQYGWIENTDRVSKSLIPRRHRRPVAIWKSLR